MSAIIAELAMRDADQKIREIPGVYKYFRYSDDILLFSHGHPEHVYCKLSDIIQKAGFRFNRDKSKEVYMQCKLKEHRRTVSFEYLGYKFTTHDGYGDEKPRQTSVSHSERKLAKLKTRIILSLKRYAKDGDFALLLDRLRFLSSNYFAYRNGATSIKTSPFVKSGIYYNYQLCGQYQAGRRQVIASRELKSLDAFYHSPLSSKSSAFSPLFSSTANATRLSRLKRISFHKGFELKITVRFRPERVQQIKEAWRNA